MKYQTLRNKQTGGQDLDLTKNTYKKKRLQEIRLQELVKEAEELGLYEEDMMDNPMIKGQD